MVEATGIKLSVRSRHAQVVFSSTLGARSSFATDSLANIKLIYTSSSMDSLYFGKAKCYSITLKQFLLQCFQISNIIT